MTGTQRCRYTPDIVTAGSAMIYTIGLIVEGRWGAAENVGSLIGLPSVAKTTLEETVKVRKRRRFTTYFNCK